MKPSNYTCPICQQRLTLNSNAYRCAQNHSFDQAKEGYVNLLPVQHKHSKAPGDNKEMVNARRAFLEQGFYQPLIEELSSIYLKFSQGYGTVLDSGCGEGFYTSQHKTDNNQVYGVDIAKNAIRIAAKKYKACQFSVASIAQFPFESEFFDWIYSVYAPLKEEEFIRLLKPDAHLVTVTPAKEHLFSLKEMIYEQPQKHKVEKNPLSQLHLIEERNLSYTMSFTNSQDVLNLLAMTPFAFKTSDQLIDKIKSLPTFECQADFLIRIYKKV